MTLQPPVRNTKDLWQDYLFLTREMINFLGRKEFDLFFDLMNQREKLQEMLDQAEDTFRRTPEGRALLEAIRQENMRITAYLRFNINQMQQQQTAVNAYEGGMPSAGRRFDHQG